MYSKKSIINRKKQENNNREKNKNINEYQNPPNKIYTKNNLTYRSQDHNSFNYAYLKDRLKKSKNNFNKFYIKKTLKLLNNEDNIINKEINDNSNYQKDYFESIIQERIKKKKNLIYSLNPQNLNSKSNINEFDYSANLSKESIIENLNNYNYNISGYNTINNVGIEIKLDNNTCSSISSNKIQNSINYGINKYNFISKPERNYFNVQSRINSKRENLRKNCLHKSTPDLNKFLNLINSNSRDNSYFEKYCDKHKLTINSKTNTNNFNDDKHYQSLNIEKNSIKRKRTKSYKYEQYKIKKELEYRKKEFEKMRSIEKKIKKYFVDNGVSFKNRELYHQSGIIIQSNFRSFLAKKKVKKLLKYKEIIDILDKICYRKKTINFQNLVDNIKKCKNNFDRDDTNSIHDDEIENKKSKFKVEIINNFSIINNIKSNSKIEEENKFLKIKLKELETYINKLKRENEIYKNKYFNNNNLKENKIDNHKLKENIENVSKELEEMKSAKKKNDNINLTYNLKSYININNKNFRKPNSINLLFDMNDYKGSKDIKYLYLKYLITLRITKTNANKKLNFYKFITNMKSGELNKIIQMNKIKQMMNIIKTKLNKNVYLFFFQLHYIYLYSKFQKPFL